MPDSLKRMLFLLEILAYVALYVVLASGRFDDAIGFTTSIALPFAVTIIIITVIMLSGSMIWHTFLNVPRTVSLIAVVNIIAYKFAVLPDSLSEENAFVIFFMPLLLAVASRGLWKMWLGSLAIFWVGMLLNFYVLNGLIDVSYLTSSFLLSSVSGVVFISAFSRIPMSEYGEKVKVVPPKKKQQDSEIPRAETGVQQVIDATTHGEISAKAGKIEANSALKKELESVVYFMDRIFNSFTVAVFLYDADKNYLELVSHKSKSAEIKDGTQVLAGQGPIGGIIETKKYISSGNVALYTKDLGYYIGNETVNSLLAVPITTRQKELLGVLVVDSKTANAYKDHHRDALSRFARITGELLSNVRMRKMQELAAARFQLFYESSQIFSKSHKHIEIIEQLLEYIHSTDEVFRVSAVAYSDAMQQVRVIKLSSSSNELAVGFNCAVQPSLLLQAVQAQDVIYEGHYQRIRMQTPIFATGEPFTLHTQSVLIFPFGKTGADYDVLIVIEGLKVEAFPQEIKDVLVTVLGNGASAYEKAFLHQQMKLLATTDGLTKLTNHRTFQDKLHESIIHCHRYDRPLALLLMDIDHFKNFNDTYGHQVGDKVLEKISRVLESCVRTTDVAARYGGEEFVVILPETDSDSAVGLAERIREAIATTEITTETEILHVSVSIGVASLKKDGMTQEQLIGAADAAMYVSKEDGRNRVTVYQAWMSEPKE